MHHKRLQNEKMLKLIVASLLCMSVVLAEPAATQDLCKINPCQNYGICTVDQSKKAKCMCLKQYTGPFCEVMLALKKDVEAPGKFS